MERGESWGIGIKIRLFALTIAMLFCSQVAFAEAWILWERYEEGDGEEEFTRRTVILKPSTKTHALPSREDCLEAALETIAIRTKTGDFKVVKEGLEDTFLAARRIFPNGNQLYFTAICYPSNFDPRGKG